MSIKKPASIASAPTPDSIDALARAASFGNTLHEFGVNTCKFKQVNAVSITFVQAPDGRKLSSEELLQYLVYSLHKNPAEAVDAQYKTLLINGKIKSERCSGER